MIAGFTGSICLRALVCRAVILILLPHHLLAQEIPVQHIYTADPSARVFNDTLYIYPSHDRDDAQWFDMTDWHVFSTVDLQHWTDHGVALSLDQLKWAKQYAWAPDAAMANGQYYFFFPVDKSAIGVAVSGRPEGPFSDTLGKPLVTRSTPGVSVSRGLIDPCVFTDSNGTSYLIFGQGDANIVRLNEDMISISDTVQIISGLKHYFEAPWMHFYKGKYYLSYAGRPMLLGRAKLHYAMSDHPYGPFTYKGVLLERVNTGTSHGSIVQFKGQWYLFYHTADLYFQQHPDGGKQSRARWYRRSFAFKQLHYHEDGTLQKVIVD